VTLEDALKRLDALVNDPRVNAAFHSALADGIALDLPTEEMVKRATTRAMQAAAVAISPPDGPRRTTEEARGRLEAAVWAGWLPADPKVLR
jgi:hypothetical protein